MPQTRYKFQGITSQFMESFQGICRFLGILVTDRHPLKRIKKVNLGKAKAYRHELRRTQNTGEVLRDYRNALQKSQKPGVAFPHESCSSKDLAPEIEAIALTQYTLKKGLQEFGQEGMTALGKEMGQLHTRKVGKPIDSESLTRDQKRASLQYLVFLTKK
jgi:hypothetical protein